MKKKTKTKTGNKQTNKHDSWEQVVNGHISRVNMWIMKKLFSSLTVNLYRRKICSQDVKAQLCHQNQAIEF